ncbi:GNAT family N-acetyltransferase [Soonwooa sp.]|uniref:GNAT family N-acetyltransferase n=1 Tax=Soonwooa sp. TaxID=1938592 RepID=UPI00262AC16B|nr:GNAT family N-acetyltransferase [Soonwooa sp.]
MDFPKLETEHLILDAPKEADLGDITKILNNEIYAKNTINIPFPYSIDSAKFWLNLSKNGFKNDDQYIFAIRLKNDQKIIGGIDLGIDKIFNKAELGYWLDQNCWNQGFATEAVIKVLEFGFENLKLKRIFATHFDFNPASGKVLEKAGMKKEGELTAHTKKENNYQNHILYAIVNENL